MIEPGVGDKSLTLDLNQARAAFVLGESPSFANDVFILSISGFAI
jgi:hypothetical protein